MASNGLGDFPITQSTFGVLAFRRPTLFGIANETLSDVAEEYFFGSSTAEFSASNTLGAITLTSTAAVTAAHTLSVTLGAITLTAEYDDSEVVDEPPAFNPGAGGGWGFWKGASTEKDQDDAWKKRRKKLKELEDIIRRAAGEIPDDAPEKQPVKAAAVTVEKAAAVKQHPLFRRAAPPPPIAPLLAAAHRAEQALLAYKTRKFELVLEQRAAALEKYKSERLAQLIAEAEEDDEDVLLLLS
jgi:hypothetical protein